LIRDILDNFSPSTPVKINGNIVSYRHNLPIGWFEQTSHSVLIQT